jgi:hypothetical protein
MADGHGHDAEVARLGMGKRVIDSTVLESIGDVDGANLADSSTGSVSADGGKDMHHGARREYGYAQIWMPVDTKEMRWEARGTRGADVGVGRTGSRQDDSAPGSGGHAKGAPWAEPWSRTTRTMGSREVLLPGRRRQTGRRHRG